MRKIKLLFVLFTFSISLHAEGFEALGSLKLHEYEKFENFLIREVSLVEALKAIGANEAVTSFAQYRARKPNLIPKWGGVGVGLVGCIGMACALKSVGTNNLDIVLPSLLYGFFTGATGDILFRAQGPLGLDGAKQLMAIPSYHYYQYFEENEFDTPLDLEYFKELHFLSGEEVSIQIEESYRRFLEKYVGRPDKSKRYNLMNNLAILTRTLMYRQLYNHQLEGLRMALAQVAGQKSQLKDCNKAMTEIAKAPTRPSIE